MITGAAVQLIGTICDRKSTIPTTTPVFKFAVDVIRQTTNIHAADLDIYDPNRVSKTALMQAISSTIFGLSSSTSFIYHHLNATSSVLRVWLEALRQAGVDLNTYGQREHEIFADDDSLHYFNSDYRIEVPLVFEVYLIDFTYGPEPDDWRLYWRETTDEFAGDFWKLIEDPPLNIPGSWVD